MSEHMCPIHGVEFFKTPRMKGYAHPVTDAAGKKVYKNGKQVWCNEDDLTSGEPEPVSMPQPQVAPPNAPQEERTEWAPHPKKQASIEAQNARTALTSLMIAGKLTTASIDAYDPLEFALVSQLTDRAGVTFKGFKNKQGTMVDAAKAAGAVEKKQFPNLGAFLNKCHSDLGLERADVEKMLDTKLSASTDFDGAWVALQNMQ